jgi:hypothetical protein
MNRAQMIRIAGACQEPLMSRFPSLALVSIVCVLSIPDTAAHAGPAHLAMSSLIQYSKVIQGAQDPVYAYIYNDATVGSDPLSYKVSTTYPYPSPYSFTGTPGNNIPVSVTGLNTESGGFVTQSGTVTVLGHAAPALILQGQIVYLTSKTTTTFQTPTTNAFGGAPPGGGEMAASANPQLLGDPPGVPTAELDLDSITTSGSAFITTTLKPFIDLPANDDPAEALPFAINVVAPAIGDYSTTFLLHYSDEQDLPGALIFGSEIVSFNVNANMASDLTTWTITSVPEPSSWQILGGGAVASALLWRFRRRTASCSA